MGFREFSFIALAGYLFAAFFLYVGYRIRVNVQRTLESSLVARGTIVSLESAAAMSLDSLQQVFHPVFAFIDFQGNEHRVRSKVGTFPATHKVGETVEVFYQSASPHEAIIDPKDFTQVSRICFFAAAIATVISTLLVILERQL